MKMNLSKFFDSGEIYHEFSGEVDNTGINFPDRQVEIIDPIEYDGEIYVLEDGEMNIHIDINFKYEEPCSRCLKKSTKMIETTISGKLIEGQEENHEESDDDEQEDIIFFENNELDISYYVISEVYLALPMQTLCKSDCKGLCSKCGNDFNLQDCDCTHEDIDPRLAKLKEFLPKE